MCEKINKSGVCEKMTNATPETTAMIVRSAQGSNTHRRQILAAMAVSLGPFAAGLSKGYMSPAIDSMQDIRESNGTSFTVSDQQASWIASLSILGALVGGILGGMAMKWGRQRVLLVAALPYMLCWLATALSSSVNMISATSFCGGLLICLICMTTQVYVTEIAEPTTRGCLSSVLKILNHIGILISFSLGAYLKWSQLALVVAVAPVLLFFALWFIPETPSFLLLRGREDEALKSLQWLKGPDADTQQELATIRTNILTNKQFNGSNGSLKALLSRRFARPVLITCGLMFFQRFSGTHFFNVYAVPMFKKTFRTMNPHGGAITISVVQLLASCLSGMLIDNVGRRPLLLVSGGMMSIALAGFGVYVYGESLARSSAELIMTESRSYDWIPLVCVVTFTIAFALGIGPISSLLIGELFPLEHRGTGSALATSFSYLCGFVNIKTSVDIQERIGLYGLFWLYAGISVCCLLFVWLFVPETKGRSIDEMDPQYVESLCINR